jgi:hypothetical protein
MGGLIWRAAPYLVRLFWPAVLGAVLAVLGAAAFADGHSGDMPALLAAPAVAISALGLAGCLLWAGLSIRAYRRRDTPLPPL